MDIHYEMSTAKHHKSVDKNHQSMLTVMGNPVLDISSRVVMDFAIASDLRMVKSESLEAEFLKHLIYRSMDSVVIWNEISVFKNLQDP